MSTLLGIYAEPAKAAVAIAALQSDGISDITAYSPAPDHAIERLLRRRVSPVRLFTLVGALVGCVSGFALPIYTVYDWPLITGGKPLISIPPFVVIAFELTILLGAIGGVIGFLTLAGLPAWRRPPLHDARFSDDHFGVAVRCTVAQVAAARAHLAAAGALEVRTDA